MPGTLTYTASGTNAKGVGTAGKVDVNWASSGGTVPICTIAASSPSPTAGAAITLSSSCSQSPLKYEWLSCSYYSQTACSPVGNCPTTATSCAVTQAVAGYAHYALRASNGAGPSAVWAPTSRGRSRAAVVVAVVVAAPACSRSAR